jgi:hypothetical protein
MNSEMRINTIARGICRDVGVYKKGKFNFVNTSGNILFFRLNVLRYSCR